MTDLMETAEYFNGLSEEDKRKFCYNCYIVNLGEKFNSLPKKEVRVRSFFIEGIIIKGRTVAKYSQLYVKKYASYDEKEAYRQYQANYDKSSIDVDNYRYSFRKYIKDYKSCNIADVNKAAFYYAHYASDKEKIMYEETRNKLLKRPKIDKFFEERIYNYCESVNFDIKKMYEYAINNNIQMRDLIDIINKSEIAKVNSGDLQLAGSSLKSFIIARRTKKYFVIFERLMELRSDKEIVNYLRSISFNPKYATKGRVDKFVATREVSEADKDKLVNEIISKIELYNNYLKQLIAKDRKKELAKIREKDKEDELDLINDIRLLLAVYINGDFDTLTSFCSYIKKEVTFILECIAFIKEEDPEFYNRFCMKEEIQRNRYKEKLLNKTRFAIDLIRNGVRLEYGLREFNYFDYYQLFRISKEELLEIIKDDLSEDEIKTLNEFFREYGNAMGIRYENVLEFKDYTIIDGVYYELKREDKEYIINYLKENNFPELYMIYTGAKEVYVRQLVYGIKKENIHMRQLVY